MSAAELESVRTGLQLIDEYGQVALMRSHNVLAQLDGLGIAVGSPDAEMLNAIVAADYEDVRESIDTLAVLDALGIVDAAALGAQFRIVGRMYDGGYLSGESVNAALDDQLDAALKQHLVIRRPGNRVLNADDLGGVTFGILKNEQDLEVLFLRLGDQVLLFFPSNLEKTIVRAIPFIIAGLAVGLGFKAGLFNIGAEGSALCRRDCGGGLGRILAAGDIALGIAAGCDLVWHLGRLPLGRFARGAESLYRRA